MDPSSRDPATGMPFPEKLRTFGLGALVGCALGALLIVTRCQMAARDRALQQQQQQQGAQPAATPTPAPAAPPPTSSLPSQDAR